jgi:hypothetical protein
VLQHAVGELRRDADCEGLDERTPLWADFEHRRAATAELELSEFHCVRVEQLREMAHAAGTAV